MLRQVIITRKLAGLRSQLAAILEKGAELITRKVELEKREAELEAAINEITDETPEEDKKAVEDSVEEFENEQKTFEAEAAAQEESKNKLEQEIEGLQQELDELNMRSAAAPQPQPNKKREDERYMRNRNLFGDGLKSIIERQEVKEFIERTRGMIGSKRAVTNAELTIPEIMLDLLKDNMYRYSKLITKVRVKSVGGKSRQNIMGTIPEGVWTEAVGTLNEMELSFNQIEVDGYKVGGFIPVPNSTLEDSDINLASEVLDAIGQAIGLALDKAILYGTGIKMPLGIVTRLAQITQPDAWGSNAPTWVDLHTSNIKAIDMGDTVAEEFFSKLMLELGAVDPTYSNGAGTFWAMNRQTRMAILANAITINAAGAIVAGFNASMPIEGGSIVELPFMEDGDIVGGFGALYLLAERAGSKLAVSEHVRFIEDQTVFKGTARYDGMPVLGGAFIAINIDNQAPATTVDFAVDLAND